MKQFSFSLLALLALLTLAACGGGPTPTPLAPLNLIVTVSDSKFEPNLLTARVNQPVSLTVQNQGTKPHSFIIDELKLNTGSIAPGASGTATFTPQQIRTYTNGGAYIFYSDAPGDKDAGLTGNLSVNP